MPRRLVLASASPARRRLLLAAGIDHDVVVSGVDETARGSCREQVLELAMRKADAVALDRPEALVLGCDSLLEIDGAPLGKPPTAEAAAARWQRMRGREGVLMTGHCLIDGSACRRASDVAATVVRFGQATDAEIAAYVATGEALAVAGAFTLDGRSAPFIEGIDGDPSNVIGLSLPLLRRLLGEIGIAITDLWDDPPVGERAW